MKRFLAAAAGLAVIVVGMPTVTVTAWAQQIPEGQAAEAAHKGTFNYFRVAPNHKAHIIQKMRQGTRFTVTGPMNGEYYPIVVGNQHGWTFKGNVHFLGTPASASAGANEGANGDTL